jgi:hypothetical protein
MPTPVRLDFVPPTQPDIAELHAEESTAKDGVFFEIFSTTAVGSYPNYISYATVNAQNPNDWFRIYWLNAGGAKSPYSEPIQGGTTTLVQTIIDRVMLRNPNLNETIVTQTAEWIITTTLGVTDPYDPTLEASYAQLEGMTLLTMAWSMFSTMSVGTTASYTAGLVSQSAGTNATSGMDEIKELLEAAAKILGISYSVILQMADNEIAGGSALAGIPDQTRLLVELL